MLERRKPSPFLIKALNISLVLALVVLMLGAYTRLTDAGLGCPDWPFCYGRITPMKSLSNTQIFPGFALEKAWTEMAHRYLAGSLGLLVFLISFALMRMREIAWGLLLVLLIVLQAALGMYTVTLKLLPLVVMGHLLGGMLIFSLLCYLRVKLSSLASMPSFPAMRLAILLGIFCIFVQIALGGWVSANYAGIACVGFPQCNGSWWPHLSLHNSFHLLTPLGVNYQGGVLDVGARVTIQFIHRLGALISGSYVLILTLLLFLKAKQKGLQSFAALAFCLVLLQWGLGIMNVVYLLPLPVAVAHNGVAALLLATLVMMLGLVARRDKHA